MDKRLSLALLLTAAVVAVTPILFPGSRRTEQPKVDQKTLSSAPRTSPAAAPSVVGTVPPQTSPPVVAPGNAQPPGVSVPSASSDSATAHTVAVVRPELTVVNTNRATYQFSNVGAAPVAVMMREYRNLAPAGGSVELKNTGRALVQYSIVTQGDTIRLDRVPFQLTRSQKGASEVLTYRAAVAGLNVAVGYELASDKYLMGVSGNVEGLTGPAYLLTELPTTLPPAESDTLGDLQALAYSFKPIRDNASGLGFGKLDPGEKRLEAGPHAWAAVRNKYFVIGLINPQGGVFDEIAFTGGARTSKIATHAAATVVKSMPQGTFEFDIYAGPQQSTELLSVGRDFDNVNPYGWSFMQGVVNPIAALCIRLLLWMHENLKLSYGWVLVIFGVMVRIALWPLNQSAMRSSLKMQEIQPRLAEVQKKYKDKPEKQREEMMRVYKEAGASPFTALSGCLPALIPMPVLFALFFVFQNTIEFRGVPFLWLTDISIKDPFYILPVLMGASMYVLSWIGLRNAPPNPQAKMMGYMFPVMMTFVLANMASGLNLYYTAQNIAALPQQWLLARERAKMRRPT
ncbi:MAG TPA: membrane protein insertase YidC [Gemmatimonadaceae bacterium]|nr:membrane protein insertase YidC [Gemmatimonadaceae bacterium]